MDQTINNFLSQLQNESSAINSAFLSSTDAKKEENVNEADEDYELYL